MEHPSSPGWYSDGAIDRWVDLTPETGAYGALDVRNQYAGHSVLIRYIRVSTGATEAHCMDPETTALFAKPNEDMTLGYIVTGLKVQNAASCP